MRRVTLLYDGDCGVCSKLAEYARTTLPRPPELIPNQFVDLDEYGVTPEQVARGVQLIVESDHGVRRWSGMDAILRMLQLQPNVGIRYAGFVGMLPGIRHLARGGYRVFANNRHRLPGSTCQVHFGPQA